MTGSNSISKKTFAPLARSQRNMMLFADPPEHTRLRGLVNKAFTPRVAESLRPRIQGIVHDLLVSLDGAREFDVIEFFAYPLPVLVILELLGVPAKDRVKLILKHCPTPMLLFWAETLVSPESPMWPTPGSWN